MEGFPEECERLWLQLKPLYEQLHAYVLRELKEEYADHIDEFPDTGHIPAHLLGEHLILKTTLSRFSFIILYTIC